MFDFKNLNIRLLLAGVVLFVIGFLLNDPVGMFESDYDSSPKLLSLKTKSDVDAITIKPQSGPEIFLKKSQNGWSVKASDNKVHYPADSKRIEGAIEKLIDLRKFYDITSSPDKYAGFELDDKGLTLTISMGGKKQTLIIGKQGSSFNTSLVRLKTDKTVYSVRGNLKSDWNQNMDFFRNKKLFQLSRDNLSELVFSGPQNYILKSTGGGKWDISFANRDFPTNSVKINRILDDLISLEGMEFYYLPQTGYPYGSIRINLKSNTSFTLQINKWGTDYLVKSEYNPYWQKIPEYRIKSLFPAFNDVKAPEQAGAKGP